MVLLVLVPSPPYVATRRRELLPRGFTLTLSGGLFSVTAFIRLLPSALSAAGCPGQSGLSSAELARRRAAAATETSYLYLFVSKFAFEPVVLDIQALDLATEGRSDVLAMFVALH